jgi:uncharacterized protein with GYD domain
MFGKFSVDAVREISAERTKRAAAIVDINGGKVKDIYALLGETDVVAIVDFPGLKEAMKASVELTKLLGISFITAPTVPVEEFDSLMR